MAEYTIRGLRPDDYDKVIDHIDQWWGGRPMRAVLPRLFFEHFNPTSFAVDDGERVLAFLAGFVSQSDPKVAYIHFVGVSPALRGAGVGRALYERFFETVRARGCAEVHCMTAPVNTGSIAFHRKMGFAVLQGTGKVGDIPVFLDHAGQGAHRVVFRKRL